jgi:hypothetical protein
MPGVFPNFRRISKLQMARFQLIAAAFSSYTGGRVEIENSLNHLESLLRDTQSATLAAEAHYLALLDEPSSTQESLNRARQRWEKLETRRLGIGARIREASGSGERAFG